MTTKITGPVEQLKPTEEESSVQVSFSLLSGGNPSNNHASIIGKATEALTIHRSVAALPYRASDGTWTVFSEFLGHVASSYGFHNVRELRIVLEAIRPVARYILIMRLFEGGYIEFQLGDLKVHLTFHYGEVSPVENLGLPPIKALNPLTSADRCVLTLFLTDSLDASELNSLVTAVALRAAGHSIDVRLDVCNAEGAFPKKEDEDVCDN